jgi:hypothetical protein
VAPGDQVVDFGLVDTVHVMVKRETVAGVSNVATGQSVGLVNVTGDQREFDPDEQVYVFRVHDS